MSRIVAIGASAGGVEALQKVVAGLPVDLDASVFVVLHIPAFSASNLPAILARAGPLPVSHGVDRQPIVPGRIYVAPPDRHLLMTRSEVRVVRGPHENNHRPAVDVLFRSAALAFGATVIGVVLTGTMDDGAAGAAAISAHGGSVVVQDPEDALYPAMPINAIAADSPEYVVSLEQIPELLARLVREPAAAPPRGEEMDDELQLEQSFAAFEPRSLETEGPGQPATFACPTCGGTLWESDHGSFIRFRCRVGHAFGADSLLQAQEVQLDEALWTALRALEERASLSRRVAKRVATGVRPQRARRFEETAAESERHAAVIRDVLLGTEPTQA